MLKWEYRIESLVFGLAHDRLNALGSEGWELVAIGVAEPHKGHCVFKRPLPPAPRVKPPPIPSELYDR